MQLVENSVNPLLAKDEKTLSGLFAEMGTWNQNNRKYPEDIYETAYNELLPKIEGKRLLGELDHPIGYDEVRLSNVSHAITECRIVEEDGVKKVYGTVELLDTPPGMIAQALVKAGIPLGVSSRGVGATRPVREGDEVTQLKLITYDLVAEPSFSNAILSPDKSKELSDSLHYIETNLPLSESVESQPVRSMIHSIRESLLSKETKPTEEINIDRAEIDSLKGLLESAQETIKSDTERMISSRTEIKSLRRELRESRQECKDLMDNMSKLQEAYNILAESNSQLESLKDEVSDLRKKLAVERRGMSYSKVSELLEGVDTEEDIENRLSSINSLSKVRQKSLDITKDALTESRSEGKKKVSSLASIIARI